MSHNPFDQRFPGNPAEHRVVILGASPKPARYAFQAQRLLMEQGYTVIPVHPKVEEIEGIKVIPNLQRVEHPVHTLTLYVGPDRGEAMLPQMLELNPKRVIFNPGTESALLQQQLGHHGVECIEGCTLVMLKTGQF